MKKLYLALFSIAIFTLMAVIPVSADTSGVYYRVAPYVNQGATVFVGEEGLNIQSAMNSANAAGTPTTITTIGWWSSAANLQSSGPDATVPLDTNRIANFYVNPLEFDAYQGEWYLVDPANNNHAKLGTGAVINVKAPQLDVSIWDFDTQSVTSKKPVPIGHKLGFRIATNMYSTLTIPSVGDPLRYPIWDATGSGANTDGYIDLVVRTESGSPLNVLYTSSDDTTTQSLKALAVWTQPFYWGMETRGDEAVSWATDAAPGGVRAYQAGTYYVSAESKLNNMYNNYLSGGAAYTGRTVSQTKAVKLAEVHGKKK